MVEPSQVKNKRMNKPYLGGWRHTITKVIYHNASSQTGPLAKSNEDNICSREMQCIDWRDNSCQTRVHVSTQMCRMDYYIPNVCDKYLSIKHYETFDERQKKLALNDNAKIIQRAYRSWKIIKIIKYCAKYRKKMIEDCKKYEEEKLQRDEKRNQLAIIRQTFPQSRADFAMNYGLIDTWRRAQSERIKEKKSRGVDLGQMENCRILKEHITMLRNVDKHRQYLVEEYKKKKLLKFLTFHCKGITWNGYKGKIIEMVTLRVQKARELKTLHDNLCCSNCTVEERIEMLIVVKSTLDAHNCCPAIDLSHLIDQEIMLLSSGIKIKFLNNLQKRISLAFLYFIRQSHDCCMKNDNSSEMELVEPIDNDKILCRSCKQLLSRNKFTVHARMKTLTKCYACGWLQQQSIERIDYDPYSFLLNEIRANEQRKNCYSNLLYVIQPTDIYYLVKIIWHGRSIVSGVNDIFRLRLARFYLNDEWSPWNCILLTEQEYEVHYYIKNLNNVYSKPLQSRIYLLHEIARVHFNEIVLALMSKIVDHHEDKAFLGGWKNIVTSIEYFDATTQTYTHLLRYNNESFKRKYILAINRMTQTSSMTACKYTSVFYNKVTQTTCMPGLNDKLMTPSSASRNRMASEFLRIKAKELFHTRKYSRLEEESAIKIQRFLRACRARSEISSLARFAIVTRTQPPIMEKPMRLSEDKRFEIVQHRPPRSRADFEMLQNVLDRWRIMENERVDRLLFGSSRIAAKTVILLREIELLRSIELAKSRLRNEHQERSNLEYLDKLAKLETWRTRNGKVIEVETLRVACARECRSLYHILMRDENVQERIETLNTVKKYIYGHTCDISRELEYLIDQEINFSSRHIQLDTMDQLRRRIKMAFFRFTLIFCEYKNDKKHSGYGEIAKFCSRCGKLLPSNLFVDEDQPTLPICNNCIILRPTKNPKILFEPYEQMLKDLRKSEMQMGSFDSLAFHITPRILHHLVNNIWHGKSGISEFDDLFQLRLLRFRQDSNWSPWNTILLTKREAAIHQAMTNPWELYETCLVKRFVLRNLQAKLYYASLAK